MKEQHRVFADSLIRQGELREFLIALVVEKEVRGEDLISAAYEAQQRKGQKARHCCSYKGCGRLI